MLTINGGKSVLTINGGISVFKINGGRCAKDKWREISLRINGGRSAPIMRKTMLSLRQNSIDDRMVCVRKLETNRSITQTTHCLVSVDETE